MSDLNKIKYYQAMKNNNAVLLEHIISPIVFNMIEQPMEDVDFKARFSFIMTRKNIDLYVDIYNEDEKDKIQIRRWTDLDFETLVTGYCRTPEEFKEMIDGLDRLLDRIPK